MKTNLDLLTRLHFELNLDNFFAVNISKYQLSMMGWHTDILEKLLYDRGYQVQWYEKDKKYKYIDTDLIIYLIHEKDVQMLS